MRDYFSFYFIVIFLMFAFILKQHKVLNSVIYFNSIKMMNSFFGFKISTQVFFHDKTMLKNIISTSFKRMIRCIYQHISIRIQGLSLKSKMIFSCHLANSIFANLSSCFNRMMASNSITNFSNERFSPAFITTKFCNMSSIPSYIKYFIALFTDDFYSFSPVTFRGTKFSFFKTLKIFKSFITRLTVFCYICSHSYHYKLPNSICQA